MFSYQEGVGVLRGVGGTAGEERVGVSTLSLNKNKKTFYRDGHDGDTHELHLPSENAYFAHRHTLRLLLFTRARTIALSLQYYTIAHIAPSPDTSCHHFELSDTSSALATRPIA